MTVAEMDVKLGTAEMRGMVDQDIRMVGLRLGRQFLKRRKEMVIGYVQTVATITMPPARSVTDVLALLPADRVTILPDEVSNLTGAAALRRKHSGILIKGTARVQRV